MKQFAPTQTQDLRQTQQLFSNKALARNGLLSVHRPIPAPEPDPEPNPGPDTINRDTLYSVTAADWHLLFQALQQRLERCAGSNTPEVPTIALHDPKYRHDRKDQLHAWKAVVMQCAQDMKLLGLLPRSGGSR